MLYIAERNLLLTPHTALETVDTHTEDDSIKNKKHGIFILHFLFNIQY